MQFNIPQFIDKEDKIVGPLTAKQLGWLFSGGAIMLILWAFLDTSALIAAGIPIALIVGALAFYRPNNQPLIRFLLSSVRYFTRPKMYVWKRIPEQTRPIKKTIKNTAVSVEKRELSGKKIEDISKILDQS